MHVLILTIGSHGDVHPFLGLALALQSRGHEVTFATNGFFQPLIERAGIATFRSLGTSEEFTDLLKSPDLWHRRRGFGFIFNSIINGLGTVYDVTEEHHRAHPDGIVVSSTLCLGARVAQDKFGFPMATVHLAPSIFRSVIDPPKLPGLVMPSWLPAAVKRKMWQAGDRWFIDPVVCPGLNAFRAEKGLGPVSRVLMDWWHSPDLALGLWPEWFAPIQPDWPPQARLAGFPLYDESGLAPMPPSLQDFLESGEKPIAFTPGSAMSQGRQFFEASADACWRLGRRGLLLSRHREHIPPNLPPGVIHVEYAPFSELLPHVAAIVHHGGIGTTSQGLQAGVPQLVMAMSHDQPDNVERLRRLGVGAAISRWRYRGPAVARALRRLIDSPLVAQNCHAVRGRFLGHEPFVRACDLIDGLRRS